MRNMLKMAFVLALLVSNTSVFSQEKGQTKLGASVMFGLPMGDFGDFSNTGLGFGAETKYFVSEKLAIGLKVGMISFAVKDEYAALVKELYGFDVTMSTQIMPVLATFDLFLATDGFKPYLGAGAGVYMLTEKMTMVGLDVSESVTKVGVAPHFGFLFGLSESVDLNVCANYNMIFTEGSSTSFLTVNGGILISL